MLSWKSLSSSFVNFISSLYDYSSLGSVLLGILPVSPLFPEFSNSSVVFLSPYTSFLSPFRLEVQLFSLYFLFLYCSSFSLFLDSQLSLLNPTAFLRIPFKSKSMPYSSFPSIRFYSKNVYPRWNRAE